MDRCRHAQRDGVSGEPQMTITTHDDERRIRGTRRERFASASSACSACSALIVVAVATAIVGAQTPIDSWPTYHGDLSGRRYSTLKQINAGNVKGLALARVYRL